MSELIQGKGHSGETVSSLMFPIPMRGSTVCPYDLMKNCLFCYF